MEQVVSSMHFRETIFILVFESRKMFVIVCIYLFKKKIEQDEYFLRTEKCMEVLPKI